VNIPSLFFLSIFYAIECFDRCPTSAHFSHRAESVELCNAMEVIRTDENANIIVKLVSS
jgi:hypothetical protein